MTMHCSKKGIAWFTVHDEISDQTHTFRSPCLLAPEVPVILSSTVAWIKTQGCVVIHDEGPTMEMRENEKVTVRIPLPKCGSHFLKLVEYEDEIVQDSGNDSHCLATLQRGPKDQVCPCGFKYAVCFSSTDGVPVEWLKHFRFCHCAPHIKLDILDEAFGSRTFAQDWVSLCRR